MLGFIHPLVPCGLYLSLNKSFDMQKPSPQAPNNNSAKRNVDINKSACGLSTYTSVHTATKAVVRTARPKAVLAIILAIILAWAHMREGSVMVAACRCSGFHFRRVGNRHNRSRFILFFNPVQTQKLGYSTGNKTGRPELSPVGQNLNAITNEKPSGVLNRIFQYCHLTLLSSGAGLKIRMVEGQMIQTPSRRPSFLSVSHWGCLSTISWAKRRARVAA